jgi:hypothetical protein
VGPREDDQLKHETQGLEKAGHSTRAEDWRDPEPSGEDQPAGEGTLATEDRRGTPDGMDNADVENRSDIARYLGISAYPGSRDELVAFAEGQQAPDDVLRQLRSLPDRQYENTQDVAKALGIGVEEHRS